MGMRFRKSFKLGGARVNISKSGFGYSFGGLGARITKTSNGRTRRTLSIPGTGISYVSESGSKKTKGEATAAVTAADSYRFASIVFKVISIPMILFSGLLVFIYPVALLGIAIGIGEWKLGKLFKKKAEVIKNDRTI